MMECSCDNSSMQHGVQATVYDGSSKTIVIDVVAQGEKGEKGDSAELTEEQMQEIKDSVSDTLKEKFIQKEEHKGLSDENFTKAYKEQLDNLVSTYETKADVTTKLAGKVDTVAGKTLTTNDYTTPEKQKLAGVAPGANANIIETIKVNGTNQAVSDKAVDIKIATKVSELTNDKNFVTMSEVTDAVSKAGKLTKEIVTTLPEVASAKDNVIYMVKNASGISGDSYSEYMLVNGAMEKIGTTATNVDLSNYLTNDEVQGMTIQELAAMLD